MSSSKDSLSLFDLTDLISHSSSTTLFPNEDTLLSHLQSRFRADLPYTRIGATTLVSVNPLKVLANVNDATAKEYIERSYKETQSNGPPMQPHLYDLAAKVYLLMTRRHAPQTVLFRWAECSFISPL
jgi:chitin synthase